MGSIKNDKETSAMITVELVCEEHPDYKAVHKPRSKCDGCWVIFELIDDLESSEGGYMLPPAKATVKRT